MIGTRLVFTVVAVALASAGLGAGAYAHFTGKPKLNAANYGRQRIEVINRHLAEAESGYVFIAGDSHAELFGADYIPCGRRAVNGGVSGASVGVYAELLQKLSFSKRPAVVVLTIGTNDLLRKNVSGQSGDSQSFVRHAEALIRRFKALTPRVIVNAVPPVGEALRGHFDIAGMAIHADRLRGLCAKLRCEFADPFARANSASQGPAAWRILCTLPTIARLTARWLTGSAHLRRRAWRRRAIESPAGWPSFADKRR